MNIFLYNFNDYYNRIVKRYDELEDYGEWVHMSPNYNFKEGDGIQTEVVVNMPVQTADYLLAANVEGEIVSRWYIVHSQRNREGQYTLSLYRDVIADFYDITINATTFIEKATLGLNNPLIFNNENMTYNQIKQQEIPLKDKFGSPWIVGYIDRKTPETTITLPTEDYIVDYSLESVEEYDYYTYTQETFRMGDPTDLILGLNCYLHRPLAGIKSDYTIGFDTNGRLKNPGNRTFLETGVSVTLQGELEGYQITGFGTISNVKTKVEEQAPKQNWKSINYDPYINKTKVNLSNEEGKIIKAGNEYYKIHVQKTGSSKYSAEVPLSSSLGILFQDMVENISNLKKGDNSPYALCIVETAEYKLELEPISVASITLTIPGEDGRIHCRNNPYDVFAIPYDTYKITSRGTFDKDLNMRLAQQMSLTLGSQLYDLQLLPYCPLPTEAIVRAKEIDARYFEGDFEGKYITTALNESENVVAALFWLADCNFTQPIVGVNIAPPATNIECKIMNETKIYRLCSPNYASVFEINAAKNNGLKNFVAYCSYKPFTPYIQVAPDFNLLYGQNYQDARGLICSGDFSLPRTSSSWVEYELNNKNYQIMFDRQIESLERNNSIARTEQIVQGAVGTVQGAGTGGMMGGMAGGVWGAVAGGVIGGAASAIGGIADYEILLAKQREVLDFTKDQFGYTLGNIAAQPRTLTKVSSFNINNKIFPFLEIYGTTPEEEQALINKLTYNGMTVMTIGSILEFLQPERTYIKGKIIRLEGLEEDYHLALAISEEINKGVYIV